MYNKKMGSTSNDMLVTSIAINRGTVAQIRKKEDLHYLSLSIKTGKGIKTYRFFPYADELADKRRTEIFYNTTLIIKSSINQGMNILAADLEKSKADTSYFRGPHSPYIEIDNVIIGCYMQKGASEFGIRFTNPGYLIDLIVCHNGRMIISQVSIEELRKYGMLLEQEKALAEKANAVTGTYYESNIYENFQNMLEGNCKCNPKSLKKRFKADSYTRTSKNK